MIEPRSGCCQYVCPSARLACLLAVKMRSLQMEHLPEAVSQGPAYQQRLAGDIHAGQQFALAQPAMKHMLAYNEPFHPGRLLRHLIAGRRIEVQVAAFNRPDPGTGGNPLASARLALPAP